jgi:hypothetical protein
MNLVDEMFGQCVKESFYLFSCNIYTWNLKADVADDLNEVKFHDTWWVVAEQDTNSTIYRSFYRLIVNSSQSEGVFVTPIHA